MTGDLILASSPALLPAALFAPTPKAAKRTVEFFTAQINNDHTRRAYLSATRRFAEWCDVHQLQDLADVEPIHVAAFIKDPQGQFSPPTVKQHLATLRMLFDWLVVRQIMEMNPATLSAARNTWSSVARRRCSPTTRHAPFSTRSMSARSRDYATAP